MLDSDGNRLRTWAHFGRYCADVRIPSVTSAQSAGVYLIGLEAPVSGLERTQSGWYLSRQHRCPCVRTLMFLADRHDCNCRRNRNSVRNHCVSGTESSRVWNSSATGPSGMSVSQTDGLEMSTVRYDDKFCSHRSRSGWSGVTGKSMRYDSGGCSVIDCLSVDRRSRTHRKVIADPGTRFGGGLDDWSLSGHHRRGLADSVCRSVMGKPDAGAKVNGAAC
jgi:hypothetical protein